MKNKNLSFHPRLSAILNLFLMPILLSSFRLISAWWMFFVWLIFVFLYVYFLVKFSYYPARLRKSKHLLSLFVLLLGSVFYLLFIDWTLSWWFIIILLTILSTISFWFIPKKEELLDFIYKPHRRINFLMVVLGLSGVFTGAAALPAFKIFINSGFLIWVIISSIISTIVAGWWWIEYGLKVKKNFAIWLGLFFFLSLQINWILLLWPIGYMAYGLTATWIWYILWILIRFHLSDKGIIWKKQINFFLVNALLFISFLLFFVRWR